MLDLRNSAVHGACDKHDAKQVALFIDRVAFFMQKNRDYRVSARLTGGCSPPGRVDGSRSGEMCSARPGGRAEHKFAVPIELRVRKECGG